MLKTPEKPPLYNRLIEGLSTPAPPLVQDRKRLAISIFRPLYGGAVAQES